MISKLSMYTRNHPSDISLKKISFIMVWKVARELVNPKNITRGSKVLQLVLNATFHSSPVLILMLLYPHHMLSLL
jgi:hypothetical protein